MDMEEFDVDSALIVFYRQGPFCLFISNGFILTSERILWNKSTSKNGSLIQEIQNYLMSKEESLVYGVLFMFR